MSLFRSQSGLARESRTAFRGATLACLACLAAAACTAGEDFPVQPPPPVASGAPVWPAPAKARVADLIRAAKLDDLTGEKQSIIWVWHLDVFVDGAAVPVPPNLGVDFVTSLYSPLHTHLYGGYVHIESPVKKTFTLGQLFILWDVPLTGATAYVNGQVAPAAAEVAPGDKQEIAVVFGKPPTSIPSLFPQTTTPTATPGASQ